MYQLIIIIVKYDKFRNLIMLLMDFLDEINN
jgi:hypothetical protein